jgi:hypothetical protein
MSGEGEAEQGFFVGLRGELGLQEATARCFPFGRRGELR